MDDATASECFFFYLTSAVHPALSAISVVFHDPGWRGIQIVCPSAEQRDILWLLLRPRCFSDQRRTLQTRRDKLATFTQVVFKFPSESE